MIFFKIEYLKAISSSATLRWYRIMAVHKCCTFRLKQKNLLSPIPDACCPLLALRSIQLMTGEQRPRYSMLQLLGESGACAPSHWQKSLITHPLSHEIYSQSSFIELWLRLWPWTRPPEKEREMAVLKNVNKNLRKLPTIHHSNIYIYIYIHNSLRWYRIHPGWC